MSLMLFKCNDVWAEFNLNVMAYDPNVMAYELDGVWAWWCLSLMAFEPNGFVMLTNMCITSFDVILSLSGLSYLTCVVKVNRGGHIV